MNLSKEELVALVVAVAAAAVLLVLFLVVVLFFTANTAVVVRPLAVIRTIAVTMTKIVNANIFGFIRIVSLGLL
jgi:hypothetical protein